MRKYYIFILLFVISCTVVVAKEKKKSVSTMRLPGMEGFASDAEASGEMLFAPDEISAIADETQETVAEQKQTQSTAPVDIQEEEADDDADAKQLQEEIIRKILAGLDDTPSKRSKKILKTKKKKPAQPVTVRKKESVSSTDKPEIRAAAVVAPVPVKPAEPVETKKIVEVKKIPPPKPKEDPKLEAMIDSLFAEEADLSEEAEEPAVAAAPPKPVVLPSQFAEELDREIEREIVPEPVPVVEPRKEMIVKKKPKPKPVPLPQKKKIPSRTTEPARQAPKTILAKTAPGKSHFEKAVELYARRDLRNAVYELGSAVDENDEDMQAYYLLADIQYQLYDMEDAWKNIRMAVNLNGGKINPLYKAIEREISTQDAMPMSVFYVFAASFAMMFTGTVWFMYRRRDGERFARVELESLKREIEVLKMQNDIQDPRVRYYRALESCENGNTMISLTNFKSAEEEFRTAIALYPQSVSAYLGLGYIHFIQQKYDTAVADYSKALDINPQSAVAYYGIGRSLGEKGNNADQLEKIQMAVQLDPGFREATEALQSLQTVSN